MAINPLMIFASLSVATLGGLVVVSQQNKKPPASPAVVTSSAVVAPKQPLAIHEPNVEAPEVLIKKQIAKLARLSPAKKPEVKTLAKAPVVKAPVVKTPDAPIAPTFDIVRVEEDGGAVVVGKAAPNAEVALKMNGKVIGRAKANEQGDWIFVPDQLVPKGSHELIVEATGKDNKVVRSKQSIIISMPENATEKPLIVISKAGAPTRVLQKPVKVAAVEKAVTAVKKLKVAKPEEKKPVQETDPAAVPVAKSKIAPAKKVKPAPLQKVIKNADKKVKLAFGSVDYNDGGDIVFSGTAQAGKTIRLYVDNKFVGDALVAKDNSWVFRGRENIKTGNHELRADQVDDSGKVAQRTAVPFIRANPVKVAALLKTRKKEPVAEPATKPVVEPSKTIEAAKVAEATATPIIATQAPAEKTSVTQTPVIPEPVEQKPVVQEPVVQKVQKLATRQPLAPPEEKTEKVELVSHVVIQPGNNLWNISRVIYGKGVAYTTIFQANKDQIKNPHRIYPGQIFSTPGVTSSGSIEPDQREPLKKASVEN